MTPQPPHTETETLRGMRFCYRNRNRKKRKTSMTPNQIAKRLNLRLESKSRHEQRYVSVDSFFSPRISLRTTSYYFYFSWSIYHLRDRDEQECCELFIANDVWQKLRNLWKLQKLRHKRLQVWGDEHNGGWFRCDELAAEDLVELLESHFLPVLSRHAE